MSSLAAARADNFYYPPEWTPNQGSLNKFHGQHALRERARKIDQGILIIRFEMPYNIWCGGCNSMIAKGVRFNAEKKQVGNYYSTKIWSFSMKSACCKHEIVIQTDPKNCEYVIISGAQKKTEDYDVEDAETFALPADEERGKLADPFYRLEHQEEDLQKKKEAEPVLVRLQRVSDSRHSDDYALNKALRAQLRNQKKRVAEFDCVRIREAFKEIGRPAPRPSGMIDSLGVLTDKFGRRAGNMKMATLAAYFGLGQQKHRSLDDVRMNLEVLKHCATVLFLESSLPNVLNGKWNGSPTVTTRSRSMLESNLPNMSNGSWDGHPSITTTKSKSFIGKFPCREESSSRKSPPTSLSYHRAVPYARGSLGKMTERVANILCKAQNKPLSNLLKHSHSLLR